MRITRFKFPGIPSVHCLFTGRGRGDTLAGNISFNADAVSALGARRAIIAVGERDGLMSVSQCHQVHGTVIVAKPEAVDFLAEAVPITAADGMMTSTPGCGLLINTADCQPILLCDASGERIMALHCGWRGNRQHFPTVAVKAFCEKYNLAPESIYAVRGPSLGFAQFTDFSAAWDESFFPWYLPQEQTINLWQLTTAQLEAAGVPSQHIYGIDICTYANADMYFSWRRRRDSGRQCGLIWFTAAKNCPGP